MATERRRHARSGPVVERFSRGARWFHAATYVTVLILLVTGWWLLTGREGDPSPLSALTGISDATLHTLVGWAFTVLALAAIAVAHRAARRFVAESTRFDRSDLRWFARWPAGAFTGRFASHRGRYDPGQRVLNIVMILGLAVLTGTGIGLAGLHGGPAFAILHRAHRIATYPVTGLILGHILVASGVLPGYRGVWRSMHLGGRLGIDVARRLWPSWTHGALRADGTDRTPASNADHGRTRTRGGDG